MHSSRGIVCSAGPRVFDGLVKRYLAQVRFSRASPPRPPSPSTIMHLDMHHAARLQGAATRLAVRRVNADSARLGPATNYAAPRAEQSKLAREANATEEQLGGLGPQLYTSALGSVDEKCRNHRLLLRHKQRRDLRGGVAGWWGGGVVG